MFFLSEFWSLKTIVFSIERKKIIFGARSAVGRDKRTDETDGPEGKDRTGWTGQDGHVERGTGLTGAF